MTGIAAEIDGERGDAEQDREQHDEDRHHLPALGSARMRRKHGTPSAPPRTFSTYSNEKVYLTRWKYRRGCAFPKPNHAAPMGATASPARSNIRARHAMSVASTHTVAGARGRPRAAALPA